MTGSEEIPYGYCHCGCGQKTKLAKSTHNRIGIVKGQPYRYLLGHSRKGPPESRFWHKVDKSGTCWEWTGTKDKNGYGLITAHGKIVRTHRLSWIMAHGDIPDGLWILHKCDNPACVRPDHLFLGTALDNMQDCKNKGRLVTTPRPGSKNPMALLSYDRVKEMRRLKYTDNATYAQIAEKMGISTSTSWRAVTGRSWTQEE